MKQASPVTVTVQQNARKVRHWFCHEPQPLWVQTSSEQRALAKHISGYIRPVPIKSSSIKPSEAVVKKRTFKISSNGKEAELSSLHFKHYPLMFHYCDVSKRIRSHLVFALNTKEHAYASQRLKTCSCKYSSVHEFARQHSVQVLGESSLGPNSETFEFWEDYLHKKEERLLQVSRS